ncbi:MAG: ATP synthase F1 subunit gamma [Candidatus Paceibacterota bacterium]
MALKQVKNKIVSTQKTGKVTKAMEAVSAVKMRKTQERALTSRPYVSTALRILRQLSRSREVLTHPLLVPSERGKALLVIVTSDKGLAGSVNSAVLKLAEQTLRAERETDVIAVGRKAVEFAHRAGRPILGEYTNVTDDVTVADVYTMAETVIAAFSGGEYKTVKVAYQNFVSTFEQKPVMRTLLPLAPNELEETMRDIRPKAGRWSEESASTAGELTYTIEPSAEEVLSVLIPKLIEIMLYHALIESKASEHSARMVAMKNATDKSKEITKALTLVYNKERQAVITAEVSEITGGLEAMKS